MRNIAQGVSLTVLGLIIGILGVVSPIAWDWWNKRSNLTVETKSSISIVGRSNSVKNLEFTFNGKKVEDLQQVVLAIKNAGHTPIGKDDVISPFTLTFKTDEVLEAKITRQIPNDLGATITTSQNVVTLAFPLLNPDDEIEIQLLTSGKYSGYSAAARIKNIQQIAVVDNSRSIKIRNDFGIGVYIAGAFGALFLIAGIAMLWEIPQKKRTLAELENDSHRLLNAQSTSDAESYLHSDFGFLSGGRKPRLLSRIQSLNWPLNPSSQHILKTEIIDVVKSEDSAGPGTFALVFSAVAFWFVSSQLFG